MDSPNVIILAGPNGAGKSTISQELLSATLKIPHFVNADTIAHGLSAFHSEDIQRVSDRVRSGGHNVPEETIRRRYRRGLENFFKLYKPLADFWKILDNSNPKKPRLIAELTDRMEKVHRIDLWQRLCQEYG